MMKKSNKRYEAIAGYLFLLPEVALMLVFVFVPMVYALYLSFTKWNGFSPEKEWVGFHNYISMMKSSEFWHSLKTTFTYMIFYVVALFVISLALALLNNSVKNKAGRLYRTLIFAPNAVSIVIAGIIWTFMLRCCAGTRS